MGMSHTTNLRLRYSSQWFNQTGHRTGPCPMLALMRPFRRNRTQQSHPCAPPHWLNTFPMLHPSCFKCTIYPIDQLCLCFFYKSVYNQTANYSINKFIKKSSKNLWKIPCHLFPCKHIRQWSVLYLKQRTSPQTDYIAAHTHLQAFAHTPLFTQQGAAECRSLRG